MQNVTGSINRVNNDATNKPPMITAANPPNKESNNNGNIPSIVVPDAITTGTIRDFVAVITASTPGFPLFLSMFI